MPIKLDTSKLTRNLVKNYKLVTHLDKHIGEGDFEWTFDYKPKIVDDGWHPSGDCVPSLHDLWATIKLTSQTNGNDRAHSIGSYKAFAVGHFWHQYLQHIVCHRLNFCEPSAVEIGAERRWGEGAYHYVSGTADIAPCQIPVHGDFLVDFKTMKSFDYKQNDLPRHLGPKWECQMNIYLDLFNLDRAIVVGVLKDSPHDFREYEFVRNEPLIDAIYTKWKLVSACLDEDVEPLPDEDIDLPLQGVTSESARV